VPATLIEDILARHGLDGPATLLPMQGRSTTAWATARHVVKVPHAAHRREVARETLAAPLARAAGVRTPALVAWAFDDETAYSIWERVEGPLLDARRDNAATLRDLGRSLARLHAIAEVADAGGVLNRVDKNDARPYLPSLPPPLAQRIARVLAACDVPRAAPRLAHFDVHAGNIVCAADGAALIDWGDAAFVDPACDFAALPIGCIDDALDGYEESATLGDDGGARILRGVIGFAARKATTSWRKPLAELVAWLDGGAPGRLGRWTR
jgi:hygromycin-B 7''-O-kinase